MASATLAATISSVWNPPAPAAAATPFVVRRVSNPRWRPPAPPMLVPGVGTKNRPRALDHLSGQVYRYHAASGGASTHWQFLAGEQGRDEDALELFATASQRGGRADLEALRFGGRRGLLAGSLGDQSPMAFGRLVSLQRLRGAMVRLGTGEGGWTLLGGVPTPVPGQRRVALELGGVALQDARFDIARLSLTAMGFARGKTSDPLETDSGKGGGGLGALGWKVPLGGGALAGSLAGQLHTLGAERALAIAQGLAWEFASRRVAAAISSERNTRHTRLLGTDRFAPAPASEDRWSLQARSSGGRAESHLTGVLRNGGEAALQTRTVGGGLSGGFGRTPWYGGADLIWEARSALEERRWSVQAGRGLAGGAAALARLELVDRPHTPATLAALGETSFPVGGGVRLELEPRLGFGERVLQHGQLTARASGPLAGSGARLTGTLAVGAERSGGFRGSVREAALALTWSPRGRDRGDLELRRLEEAGRPAVEYSARYETFLQRYETSPEWLAARDTGRVTVIVGRSGNGSGMPDVLVSLDGQALRFSDADGIARFDHVAPGIHTVAIEERSLEDSYEVVGASRVFVTVRGGEVTEPVRFIIGRMERRTRF